MHNRCVTKFPLRSKIVEEDAFAFDAQVVQHREDCAGHHRGAAEVILAVLRILMLLEVIVKQHLMDEAGVAGPVIFRLGIGQSEVQSEIIVALGQRLELVGVEDFT